jgi:hypothetical protein
MGTKTKPIRQFPFTPKSSSSLQSGDYWAVPLLDGSFACGRVIRFLPANLPGTRVGFVGGLMNWHGRHAPKVSDLAGCGVCEFGRMHILAITTSGGAVIGNLPLTPEELELVDSGVRVGAWGYGYIVARANRLFQACAPSGN